MVEVCFASVKNIEIFDVFRDYLLSLHQKSTSMNKIIILLLIGMALILMQACGSSAEEADLPVRKSCNLERLYKDMPQNIRTDTSSDMAWLPIFPLVWVCGMRLLVAVGTGTWV